METSPGEGGLLNRSEEIFNEFQDMNKEINKEDKLDLGWYDVSIIKH